MTEDKKKVFFRKIFDTEINTALFILRCSVGILMMTHAIEKMENFSAIAENFPTPFGINSWVGLTVITAVEFGCSVLIILGLATRFAAFALMLGMITAAFFTFPEFELRQSELALLYLTIYTVLFITGGGKYATDYLILRIYKGNKIIKR